jgi:transposase-like protein
MLISAKIGCTAQALNDWGKKAEVDSGRRAGIPTEMADCMKAPQRESRELREANEILRKGESFSALGRRPMARAYFAMAELDRRSK